jgi:hypothetical protein
MVLPENVPARLCEHTLVDPGGRKGRDLHTARACQVFCVNGHVFLQRIPGRLNGPERRVGFCGDATRAPTQGPGFRGLERSSAPGPGILARMRKISGFGAEPHPENVLLPISS